MNSETINITDAINSAIKYVKTIYLDYFLDNEQLYHNMFFEMLKSYLPLILAILSIYILLFSISESYSINHINIDTFIETSERAIRKAVRRFLVIGIFTICLGGMFIPFTQARITRAYDRTVEALEEMDDQEINDIDLATAGQNEIEDINEALVVQMKNVNNCSDQLHDILSLAFIIYSMLALLGLTSVLNLIIVILRYVFTFTNKRYRKFKYVL